MKATKKADKQLHLVPPLSPTMLQYVHSKTFAKRMELQDAICHCEKEIASVSTDIAPPISVIYLVMNEDILFHTNCSHFLVLVV